MGAFVRFVGDIMLTFVAVWVVIFGGNGALLSRARDGNPLTGFIWGGVLGPLGWSAIWWRTRSGKGIDLYESVASPRPLEAMSSAAWDDDDGGMSW